MIKTIMNSIKFILRLFLWSIYFLSKIIPRDERIWIFGSWDAKSFSDNPKYLFLYINQYQKGKIKAVWITKNRKVLEELRAKGFSAYMKKSLKGMYYALRGKYWFYGHFTTDIAFWLSGGAIKIDLHHGTPIKKILWDNFNNIQRFKRNIVVEIISRLKVPWRFQSPDYVLITSKKLKEPFKSAFRIDEKSFLFCGNPRTDILKTIYNGYEIGVDMKMYKFAEEKKQKENAKIILFMPTFRERGASPIYLLVKEKELLSFLEEKNIFLFIKEHPWEKRIDIKKINTDRIFFIKKFSDHNPFFRITDILITDYSSIFVDFLLTNKPIIFLSHDIRNFVKKSRELYFDFKESTPGYKIQKISDLVPVIKYIIDKGDFLKKQRAKILNEFYSVKDTLSSECVYNFVTKINEIS